MQRVGMEVLRGHGLISSWFATMYSCVWGANYKIIDQPVSEFVLLYLRNSWNVTAIGPRFCR